MKFNIVPDKKAFKVILLCWLVYFASYLGRLNYTALKPALIDSFSATNAEAGLVSSFFFVAYAVGQLISGFLADKVDPKYTMTFALFLSAAMNFIMPLMPGLSSMKYIWAMNGLIQSLLWSNIIRTFAVMLPEKYISKGIVAMSTSYAAGTLVVYGFSSFSIEFLNWKVMFFLPAAVLLIFSLLWFFGMSSLKKHTVETRVEVTTTGTKPANKLKLVTFLPVIIMVLLLAVSNGFIKDGVKEWTPNIIKDKFGLTNSLAILITLVLPMFGIAGGFVGALLKKRIKNPIFCNFVLYLGVAGGMTLCYFFAGVSIVLTMLILGIMYCFIIAINNMLVSVIPLSFRRGGHSAFISGFINSFCYVGSGISPYILGSVADSSGWDLVLLIIAVFGIAAVGVALIGGFLWRKVDRSFINIEAENQKIDKISSRG